MTKSVYLEDFGKATNAPDFLINAMRMRKIIPRDIPNEAVMITIYDSGRWKVLTDEVCEITKEDKEQAKKEIVEHNKKNQHKDINKMLDDFLAKF